MSTSMQYPDRVAMSTRTQMAERPSALYRTALGRLDLRHRLAWRLSDASRGLIDVAMHLRWRAHTMSRGEISPNLPLMLDQLKEVADSMGLSMAELVEQMEPGFWSRGASRRRGWRR